MRKPATASLLLAAVLLAGCASTSRVMISPARPALAPEQVRVYFDPPPGRYVEIALLETASGPLTYGEQNKLDSVLAKLRPGGPPPPCLRPPRPARPRSR